MLRASDERYVESLNARRVGVTVEPSNTPLCDAHHSGEAGAFLSYLWDAEDWRHPMSNTYVNWFSRVGIAGRVAERRHPHEWNELTMQGDYHLPFGKAEARAEAAKWLCQI